MKTRNLTFDVLKCIAIFFVIFVHFDAFGEIYASPETVELLNTVGFLAIPIFFTVSGYFYSKTTKPLNSIGKLVICYFFASIIINLVLTTIDTGVFLKNVVDQIFFAPMSSGYYWFFWILAILQLLFLVPKFFKDNKYLLTLIFIIAILNYFVFFSFINFEIATHVSNFSHSFTPFAIGYIFGAIDIKLNKEWKNTNLILIVVTIGLYFYTVFNLDYMNALSIFSIIALLIIAQSSKIKEKNIMTDIGQNTLMIYILHYYFWIILGYFGIFTVIYPTIFSISVITLVILLACHFSAKLISFFLVKLLKNI